MSLEIKRGCVDVICKWDEMRANGICMDNGEWIMKCADGKKLNVGFTGLIRIVSLLVS